MGEFPPREVGEQFKAFVGVSFGLDVFHKSLGRKEGKPGSQNSECKKILGRKEGKPVTQNSECKKIHFSFKKEDCNHRQRKF